LAQLYAYIPWSCNRAQIANATERKADGFMTNPNQTANVGHRYQKGHPYHPPKAPLNGGSEHQRLKSKFFRALKMEYGPELTASQKEHITNIANIRARLQLQGETIDHVTFVMLINAERRELEKLAGD
jgi:hypothetical protein